MTGRFLGIGCGIIRSREFDPATEAILASFTTPATPARAVLYNDFVRALKFGGVWPTRDGLYLLAAHDAQAARINLKAPGTFTLTEVNSPTFTADQGYTGNGSNMRLASGFTPSTAGGNWTQDSLSLWVYSLTADLAADDTATDAGTNGTGFTLLRCRNSSGNCVAASSGTGTGSFAASADGSGYHAILRGDSNSHRLRRNNGELASAEVASVAVAANEVFILNNGSANAYSSRQIAASGWGGNLTDAQSDSLHAALSTYLTAVGAI